MNPSATHTRRSRSERPSATMLDWLSVSKASCGRSGLGPGRQEQPGWLGRRRRCNVCATCDTMIDMRSAGVREARQDLTNLLNHVRKGREVVITERGRPVARLVPIKPRARFPNLAAVRRRARGAALGLTQAVIEDRDDRL